jgi:two-component system cell cycle response regulator
MRVLVADDSTSIRTLLQRVLFHAGYEVIVASDGTQAMAVLQGDDPPPIAILDWMMPGMDGVEICRQLKQRVDQPPVYTIITTAKDNADDATEAMNAGADDFLRKPINLADLEARVRAGRRIVDLRGDLVAAHAAHRRDTRHDALTKVLNRQAIEEVLLLERSRSLRQGVPFAVLFVDLDHFKGVNDVYGHAAGDAVLVAATIRMKAILRTYDYLGRYGGEEFVVALPGCDTAKAMAVAERLRIAIGAGPVPVGDKLIPVAASIGVAATDRLGPLEIPFLLGAADLALYGAKRGGRNRVEAATTVPPVGRLASSKQG